MIEDDDPNRPDVYRYIAVFSKKPDENDSYPLVVNYEFFKPVSLKFLQDVFKIDPNHTNDGKRYMMGCYDINEHQTKVLQPFVKEILDLEKYNFQLEWCANKEAFQKVWIQKVYTDDELVRFIVRQDPVFVVGSVETRLTFQKPVSLEFLCALFKVKPGELSFDEEIEDQKIAEALQPFIAEPFDFTKYNYILRCTTKESYEAWKKEANVS